MQRDDAFICDVPTRDHLHGDHALLETLDGAQPLQTRVLDVDTLVKLDLLHMF